MSTVAPIQVTLTDDQIAVIAEKAAERALEKIYAEVGQSVLKKLLWLVGVAALGFAMFLAGKGVALPKL